MTPWSLLLFHSLHLLGVGTSQSMPNQVRYFPTSHSSVPIKDAVTLLMTPWSPLLIHSLHLLGVGTYQSIPNQVRYFPTFHSKLPIKMQSLFL
jgi:hypothetical protein